MAAANLCARLQCSSHISSSSTRGQKGKRIGVRVWECVGAGKLLQSNGLENGILLYPPALSSFSLREWLTLSRQISPITLEETKEEAEAAAAANQNAIHSAAQSIKHTQRQCSFTVSSCTHTHTPTPKTEARTVTRPNCSILLRLSGSNLEL